LGNRYREGQTLNNLGFVYFEQRRFVEADSCLEQSLVICRELEDRDGEARALTNLGYVHLEQGARDRAEQYLVLALAIFQELKAPEAEQIVTTLAELRRP
jgi:Tfp pilus assembly protein PilF